MSIEISWEKFNQKYFLQKWMQLFV